MNSADENSQDFDRWLAVPDRPTNEKLFHSVLAATQPVLRQRRMFGYVCKAAAFAACYLIGVGTIPLINELRRPSATAVVAKSKMPPMISTRRTAVPVQRGRVCRPTRSGSTKSPVQVAEAGAPETEMSRYRQYRNLGDSALKKDKNHERAAYFYARAAMEATDAELAISYADDSLLLIYAKDSALKERQRSKVRDELKTN